MTERIQHRRNFRLPSLPWRRTRVDSPASSSEPLAERTVLLGAARRALRAREALYQQLREQHQPRARVDAARWREALAAAQHPDRPNPRPLLQVYDDVLLDPHLTSLLNTRRMRVLGAEVRLVHAGTGQTRAADELVHQPWLRTLIGHVVDALFYGTSVIELCEGYGGALEARLIPRAHVVPALGLLTLDATAPIPSRTDELAADGPWLRLGDVPHALLVVQSESPLGLLAQAVPLVLMKRTAMACWSEFAEVFGMPMRIARTPAHDVNRKEQLGRLLKDMGSAAYVVLDEGEALEFKENARADAYRVYDRLIERCNQELSKLINGQTLTTEPGDRGARSLGEIHDRVFDDITRADLAWVEQRLNHDVLPLVRRFAGGLVSGLASDVRFALSAERATLSRAEQWAVDAGLLEHFAIDPEYFRQNYGVPITGPK
jgi:phage gp29-like protein